MYEARARRSSSLNDGNETLGRHFTIVSNFLKNEFQLFLAQAFRQANVVEDTLHTAQAHEVVMHNRGIGNVLLETSREFLSVTV